MYNTSLKVFTLVIANVLSISNNRHFRWITLVSFISAWVLAKKKQSLFVHKSKRTSLGADDIDDNFGHRPTINK